MVTYFIDYLPSYFDFLSDLCFLCFFDEPIAKFDSEISSLWTPFSEKIYETIWVCFDRTVCRFGLKNFIRFCSHCNFVSVSVNKKFHKLIKFTKLSKKRANMKRRPPLHAENGFSEHGGYMSAKISKLEEQFTTIQAVCKQKSNIFEGISIFVNGFTNPSAEELKRIMMEHSGRN